MINVWIITKALVHFAGKYKAMLKIFYSHCMIYCAMRKLLFRSDTNIQGDSGRMSINNRSLSDSNVFSDDSSSIFEKPLKQGNLFSVDLDSEFENSMKTLDIKDVSRNSFKRIDGEGDLFSDDSSTDYENYENYEDNEKYENYENKDNNDDQFPTDVVVNDTYYTVVAELGSGAMKEVFLAYEMDTGNKVAIFRYKDHTSNSAVEREIKILLKILERFDGKCPDNIICPLNVDEERRLVVVNYIDGMELFEYVSLPYSQATTNVNAAAAAAAAGGGGGMQQMDPEVLPTLRGALTSLA